MNSDAWVSVFKSLDGGQNWKSTLLPGYPQDPARTAPLWGYDAATDPFMRAGTNGMFYFAGLAFDRGDNAPSAIFVARYKDMNNLEAGDPIVHLDTRIVDSDPGTRFLDKTALATDIPRSAATCSFNVPLGDAAGTVVPQTIPAGNVYVAYSAFTGSGANEQSVILFSRSTDCGATWRTPIALSAGSPRVQNAQIAVNPVNGHVYVTWRRFRYLSQDDAVMVVRSVDGGATFSRPIRVAGMRSMDQPTSLTSFRSNGFQTMAIDDVGRVYIAWTERGHATLRPDPVVGDARIVVSTSTTGSTWTVPRPVQTGGLGHQMMPSLTFHAGKLRLLYYDLREDISSIFAPFVDEFDIMTANSTVRHTLDVFVAQALPGAAPVFTTARLSDYAFGFLPGVDEPQRLQFNPPNLPLFRQGTTPFMGDYIDLAPAPAYVQNPNGSWSHNTAAATAVSHAFWTDNRDVRPPADNDWANYTALGTVAGQQSQFDTTQTLPGCSVGQAGMRNQNIYTARVSEGLFVSAPGNNKPLGDFQRAFVVVAENATALIRSFRLTIENQPVGGQASFLQFCAAHDARPHDPTVLLRGTHGVRDVDGCERADQRFNHRNHRPGRSSGCGWPVGHRRPQPRSAGTAPAESPVTESPAAEPADFRGRSLQRRHHQRGVCRAAPAEPAAAESHRSRIRDCRTIRSETRGCRTTRSPIRASSASTRRTRPSRRPDCRIPDCRIHACRTTVW